MISRTLAALMSSTLALSACGPSPTALTAELPFVQATNSCAPTDAPAVSIVFASSAQSLDPVVLPLLTLGIWTSVGNLVGRSFQFAAGSNDGYASYSSDDSSRDGVATGTVRILAVTRDSSIVGTLKLRLIDGTRVEREFTAPWVPTRTRCG
jgi:hypothetical protein